MVVELLQPSFWLHLFVEPVSGVLDVLHTVVRNFKSIFFKWTTFNEKQYCVLDAVYYDDGPIAVINPGPVVYSPMYGGGYYDDDIIIV